MLITRYAKMVMSLVLAAFCLLVTFDNITDYGTNYLFVQHVMSMDTTFPGNALMSPSITTPNLCRASYEHIPAPELNRGNTPRICGSGPGVRVWFFGFMGVAGEWFALWQSATWNGQEAAFRFYVAVLGVLIFVNQPDVDLPGPNLWPLHRKPAAAERSK